MSIKENNMSTECTRNKYLNTEVENEDRMETEN